MVAAATDEAADACEEATELQPRCHKVPSGHASSVSEETCVGAEDASGLSDMRPGSHLGYLGNALDEYTKNDLYMRY